MGRSDETVELADSHPDMLYAYAKKEIVKIKGISPDELKKYINNIETKSFGEIFVKQGTNGRIPYEHQKDAMANLDIMDKEGRNSNTRRR